MSNLRTMVTLLALIAAASRAAAQAPASPAPIQYYNPAWSPDGRSLAFESNRQGPFAVYSIRVDGSGLARLTTSDANNFQPQWSPDGTRIVFGSNRDGHGQIYLMNADGSGQTRLTNDPRSHFFGSFSPDGKRVVFGAQDERNRDLYYVCVIRADGSGMRQLTDSVYSSEGPVWASDGHIVFTRTPRLTRLPNETVREFMKRRDGAQTRLTIQPDGTGIGPAAPIGSASDVSPDGRWRALTKDVDGATGIYLVELATGRERLLVGGR